MVVCGSRVSSKVRVECGRPTGTGTVHHYGLLDVFNETSINCRFFLDLLSILGTKQKYTKGSLAV